MGHCQRWPTTLAALGPTKGEILKACDYHLPGKLRETQSHLQKGEHSKLWTQQ